MFWLYSSGQTSLDVLQTRVSDCEQRRLALSWGLLYRGESDTVSALLPHPHNPQTEVLWMVTNQFEVLRRVSESWVSLEEMSTSLLHLVTLPSPGTDLTTLHFSNLASPFLSACLTLSFSFLSLLRRSFSLSFKVYSYCLKVHTFSLVAALHIFFFSLFLLYSFLPCVLLHIRDPERGLLCLTLPQRQSSCKAD